MIAFVIAVTALSFISAGISLKQEDHWATVANLALAGWGIWLLV